MDSTIDPATGAALPADAIQRILHISAKVHVYNIPPMASTRGHMAASWTDDPKRHIFTCRLRIIETAVPAPAEAPGPDRVKADIILEDASTGQLFAAAPYTARATVESAVDSSRFFALRVQDPQGRKATLGIGFEERSEAFDFSVALQEAQKALGMLGNEGYGAAAAGLKTLPGGGSGGGPPEEKKDYSLKDGETITVNLSGTKFGRNRIRPPPQQQSSKSSEEAVDLSSFALPPPPGSAPSPSSSSGRGANSFLPPPPSAQEIRAQKRMSAQDLGFDDGQFGEFA
ncbi:hypothetical protein B0T25DRAFT_568410 [Lasiosphaeria hispida]|uniref:NECAP PHear domain-containing protein n=1 Tax=Lasiosphaeria hispida TaxID=260671 RepID=A0AAJ0ME74_9PEZI|nr:hypothetical protein B0T25DRAFT_568410 [Lasiosphaeria hispida]